ncbi:hypothetical protein D1781_05675 [Amnibacterium setariae]|uniref:Uncharacterized protein n=1 Tax=Amnibacterium setariae TaxID=2306585 RepID=A0A3A1U9E9_9MICO|nr:hypothetical protein D1781_05675 [Amnibacterium setariae]
MRVDDERRRPLDGAERRADGAAGDAHVVVADQHRAGVGDGGGQARGHGPRLLVRQLPALVEAEEDLPGDADPGLHSGREALEPHDAPRVDAGGPQQGHEHVPGLVRADRSDDADVGAERREVHGRVGGAAGHVVATADLHHRGRRLAAEPVRGAGDPAVEQQVADDHDRAAGEAEDPVDERVVLTPAHAAPPGRPRCTTVVVVISSSSSGP